MNLKNILKKNLTIVLFLPILFNSLFNIFKLDFAKIITNQSLFKFGSFLITSLFFTTLGYYLKKTLKINSMSLSIVFFLSSFYLFDLFFLVFTKNYFSRQTFYLVFFVWAIFMLTRLEKRDLFILSTSFFVMRLFNRLNITTISDKSVYADLNTDVEVQWLPIAKMIYENNYFYAIQNNIIDGQSIFLSYIQTVIMRLNFDILDFYFIQINANILLFISLIIIFDLEITLKNKIFSALTLFLFLINSDWLFYLFANSLMLEGLLNILVATYFFNIKKYLNCGNKMSKLFFLMFGTLALTKQFVATLSLVFFFLLIVFLKNRKTIIFSFIPISVNLFYKNLYFDSANYITYTSDLDYKDLILDFLYLRDLEFGNISKIILNLWIDKPLIIILIYFLLILFFAVNRSFKIEKDEILILGFILINTLFVFLLYISYWKNIEIQSSYRYILNVFYLIYLFLVLNFDKFERIRQP